MTAVYISLAIISVLLVAFAGLLWRARPEGATNRWLASFTFIIGCWNLGIANLFGSDHPELWARFTFATCSMMPPAFLGFVSSYPSLRRSLARRLLIISGCVGGILALLSLFTALMISDVRIDGSEVIRRPGSLYPVFAAFFVITWIGSFVLLGTRWKQARGAERLQLQYLFCASALCLSGGMIANLIIPIASGRSTHSWIGPYFGAIFIAVVGHAIIRHRLMDLRVVVHRGLTVAIAMVLSLSPLAVLVSALWPHFATNFTPNEVALGLIAIAAAALLTPLTRDVTARALDRYLYRQRTNFQRTLRDASRVLTTVLDLRRLQDFLQVTVAGAAECEGIAIYLRKGDKLRRGRFERRLTGVQFSAPAEFPDGLQKELNASRDLIVIEEFTRTGRTVSFEVELEELNWALVLPTVSDNEVSGAIALGPKLSGDPYYPQDLDLLMTLANQAGIAIKNAQLYAQVVLANEHLENILATITSAVVAVDADGTVAMFNPAAERLTGLAHGDARNSPLTALPSTLRNALDATLRDGLARAEPELELSDGTTTRPVMCTTAPLRDPDGALLGAVAVFSDLTPVRDLELQRRRAERLAYLETFASGIAHEVKNPLVAVKTFVQLIPRRREDERFVEGFARVVGREIARMERLVDRLRTLSRPGQRPRVRLDVRQPLVDALEFMQASFEEKEMRVEAALGEVDAPVLGDGNELEQLFLNLLINASEATPRGGRVGVAVSCADGHVSVAVTDSGSGIPADALGRVFEPFFTTKERGSGLGLAICAGIADTHGARVRAENVSAGGARLTVEFPLASEVSVPVTSAS